MLYVYDISRMDTESLIGVVDSDTGKIEYMELSSIKAVNASGTPVYGLSADGEFVYPLKVFLDDNNKQYLAYKGIKVSHQLHTEEYWRKQGCEYVKKIGFAMFIKESWEHKYVKTNSFRGSTSNWLMYGYGSPNGIFVVSEHGSRKNVTSVDNRILSITARYFEVGSTHTDKETLLKMQDEEIPEEWVFIEKDGVYLYRKQDIDDFRVNNKKDVVTKLDKFITKYRFTTGDMIATCSADGVLMNYFPSGHTISLPDSASSVKINLSELNVQGGFSQYVNTLGTVKKVVIPETYTNIDELFLSMVGQRFDRPDNKVTLHIRAEEPKFVQNVLRNVTYNKDKEGIAMQDVTFAPDSNVYAVVCGILMLLDCGQQDATIKILQLAFYNRDFVESITEEQKLKVVITLKNLFIETKENLEVYNSVRHEYDNYITGERTAQKVYNVTENLANYRFKDLVNRLKTFEEYFKNEGTKQYLANFYDVLIRLHDIACKMIVGF